MSKTIVYFDFDGVILDTIDTKNRAFFILFKNNFVSNFAEMAYEYHINNLGVSRYNKFRYIYENILHAELNDKIIADLDIQLNKLILAEIYKLKVSKDFLDFILKIRLKGLECNIITATPYDEIIQILNYFNITFFFKKVYSSSFRSKSEILYDLLDHVNNNFVYFGDTQEDFIAASSNSMRFILKKNSFNDYFFNEFIGEKIILFNEFKF